MLVVGGDEHGKAGGRGRGRDSALVDVESVHVGFGLGGQQQGPLALAPFGRLAVDRRGVEHERAVELARCGHPASAAAHPAVDRRQLHLAVGLVVAVEVGAAAVGPPEAWRRLHPPQQAADFPHPELHLDAEQRARRIAGGVGAAGQREQRDVAADGRGHTVGVLLGFAAPRRVARDHRGHRLTPVAVLRPGFEHATGQRVGEQLLAEPDEVERADLAGEERGKVVGPLRVVERYGEHVIDGGHRPQVLDCAAGFVDGLAVFADDRVGGERHPEHPAREAAHVVDAVGARAEGGRRAHGGDVAERSAGAREADRLAQPA